nr:unnamed protein product [Callosobruchus analis]
MFVTLSSVFNYLSENADSRCLKEGEELLNANHVLLLGATEETEEYVEVLALCFQTSSIKSSPHEIKGKLIINDNTVQISNFACSCKAGLSGTCKHTAAVLLKCTRAENVLLERLSTTDTRCYWSNKKKAVEQHYEATPILETECYKKQVKDKEPLISVQKKRCFDLLLSLYPESSLACHIRGTAYSSIVVGKPKMDIEVKLILENSTNSEFLAILDIDKYKHNLRRCCNEVLERICNTSRFEEAVLSQQNSELWNQERQFRITGSKCYSIYTFSKDNWEKNVSNCFWPKKFSSKYTEHGKKFEQEAREIYCSRNGYKVIQLGLVICSIHGLHVLLMVWSLRMEFPHI